MIHGDADPIVPYDGGEVKLGAHGVVWSVDRTVRFLAEADGCARQPVEETLPDRDPSDGTRVRRAIYGGGKRSSDVVLYTIEGGGHTWPGAMQYAPERFVGRTSHDIDGTEIIWAFFAAHPMRE
jgi:polyhydroxybutyrate depolymerase